MSKESLEQFSEKVAGSEELQARIGDEIDAESLIALGVECGFEFTAEDLGQSAELSEDELDAVAGGTWYSVETETKFPTTKSFKFEPPQHNKKAHVPIFLDGDDFPFATVQDTQKPIVRIPKPNL